MIQSVIHSMCL